MSENCCKKETIAKLEYEIDDMKKDFHIVIKEIKENHLAHIESDMKAVKDSLTEFRVKMKEYTTNQKWILLIGGFLVIQGMAILIKVFF